VETLCLSDEPEICLARIIMAATQASFIFGVLNRMQQKDTLVCGNP